MRRLNVIDTLEDVLSGLPSRVSEDVRKEILNDPHWLSIRRQLKSFGKTCYGVDEDSGLTGTVQMPRKRKRDAPSDHDVTAEELQAAFLAYGFNTNGLESVDIMASRKFDISGRPSSSRVVVVGECYFVDLDLDGLMDVGIVTNCLTVTTADDEVSHWVRYNSIAVEQEVVDDYYSACRVTKHRHLVPVLLISRPCDILPPPIGELTFGLYNRLSIINGAHIFLTR